MMLDATATVSTTPPLSGFGHVAVVMIDPDPENARRTSADSDTTARFLDTVRAQGVLVPLLLRPIAGRYRVVHGHRRLAAAVAVGMESIPAYVRDMTDAEAAAAQMAENVARERMTDLDQWRHVARLMEEHGFDLPTAGRMLGLPERLMARMAKLGRLEPALLAAMEQHGIPNTNWLATIANAPPGLQAEALKRGTTKAGVSWDVVVRACTKQKIPRARAVFDWTLPSCPVRFSQDLFAQAGTDEEWTTTDISGFLGEQRKAVVARVEKEKAAGHPIDFVEINRASGEPTIPPGFQSVWGRDDGKPLPKRGKRRRLLAVVGEGWTIGAVATLVIEPKPQAKPNAQGAAPAKVQPPITKKGLATLALAKTEAVRAHLTTAVAPSWTADQAAGALLVALTAGNVSIYGDPKNKFGRSRMADIAGRLVNADGTMNLDLVPQLAAEALSRILLVAPPDSYREDSGDAIELIGAMTGAAAALPRFDTEEFLATVSGQELRRLAAAAGIKAPEKVSTLRKALVGNLPDWRPEGFKWTAPPPRDPDEEEDEEEEDEEAPESGVEASSRTPRDPAEEEPEPEPPPPSRPRGGRRKAAAATAATA